MLVKNFKCLLVVLIFILWGACDSSAKNDKKVLTAVGKPAEGALDPFLGDSFFQMDVVFEDGTAKLREPYFAVAVDGTILAMQNRQGLIRRSEDGGKTWGEIIKVPFGFLDSNFIIDENTGDIIVIRLWEDNDRQWRSSDHGKTWKEEKLILKPTGVIKWINQTGMLKRISWRRQEKEENGNIDTYTLHSNASESGITLRHGKKKGRLIVTSTFHPNAPEHPCDRIPLKAIYSCAVYSDDGGASWQVSDLFPEGYTEEAALTELSDGRIYYNSRSHSGFYDKSLARELLPEEVMRREAWSYDYGHTWEGLNVSSVLPDGGGADRGYGNKGGLVRLPIENNDILIYSNTDAGPGDRKDLTVWASFDGGETWPIKRLVNEPRGAYSSLGAGRPGTPSEGMIYMLFEDRFADMRSKTLPPDATMQVTRFNLSWILEGELTGNGTVPEWLR